MATLYLWVFERESVDLSIVKSQVSATISTLKHLCNNPGPYLKQLGDELIKLEAEFGMHVSEAMRQES